MADIETSVLFKAGVPALVAMDYRIKANDTINEFRLSYYPHMLTDFISMLRGIFTPKAKHTIYGDFKAMNVIADPGFYIHVIQREA